MNKRKAVGPNLADEAVLRAIQQRAIQQRAEAAKIAQDNALLLLREKEQKDKERKLKGAVAAGAAEGGEAGSSKSKQVTAPLPAGKGTRAPRALKPQGSKAPAAKNCDGGKKDTVMKVKPDTVIQLEPEHTHRATVASPPSPSTPPTPSPALLPAAGGKQKRKHAESEPHSDADAAPGSKKHKKKDKKEKEGKKGKKEGKKDRSGRASASPPGSHSGTSFESLAKIQLKLWLPKGP